MRFSVASTTSLLFVLAAPFTLVSAQSSDAFSSLISDVNSLTSVASTAIGSQTTLLSSIASDIASVTSSLGSVAASATSSAGAAVSSIESSVGSQINSATASAATATGNAANPAFVVAPAMGAAGAAVLGFAALL